MSKSLQEMINDLTRANSLSFRAEQRLNDYCMEKWGYAPSDVDADQILDAIYGACGDPMGMTAKEFREIMDSMKC